MEATIDFKALQNAFARSVVRAQVVDPTFLTEVMFNALHGLPVGKDEFDRHEFEQNRAKRVAELKQGLFLVELPLSFELCSFNFERLFFPVKVQFDKLHSRHANGIQVHPFINNLETICPMAKVTFADIESAKTWKAKQSSTFIRAKASCIVRPVKTSQSRGTANIPSTQSLTLDFIGLRLQEDQRNASLAGLLNS